MLCAPSLSGESFGMVLTEAFAAGTPVIASAIAGYSDVVSDGVDGILVPPGDPQRLAEELLALHYEPYRLEEMAQAARASAARYAWPRIAARVETIYERALSAPQPNGAAERLARVTGMIPADGSERVPAERLPSLDPPVGKVSRGRRRRPPRRPARRRRGRRRAHLPGGAEDRLRQRRPQRRQVGPRLGPDRDRC